MCVLMCSGKESKELFGFLKTFYISKRTSLKASPFYFVLRKGLDRNIMATALKEKETFPISNIVIYLETNYYIPKDPDPLGCWLSVDLTRGNF